MKASRTVESPGSTSEPKFSFDVSHRFVVCVAVTYYDAFETQRVRDVAIRVLLDNNLELPLHGLIEKSTTDSKVG